MEGIDRIITRIEADGEAEGQALLEKAKKEAESMAFEMRKQVVALTEGLAKEGKKAAGERKERLTAMAGMEARKRLLSAKQDMISKAFDGALEDLGALDEARLISLLARLIAEASRNGREQIVLTMSDHARYGKKIAHEANDLLKKAGKPAGLTLSASPKPLAGGFMLSDGDIEVNGTFQALIDALKPELSAPVARLLFE